MTKTYTKTSEAVSTGHPDKLADQIADSIFDYLRTFKKDPQSAVEVACAADTLLIFGEIDKDIVKPHDGIASVEYANPELAQKIKNIAQQTIRNIGYTEQEYNPTILVKLVTQSVEINNAVEKSDEHEAAAGDQGIVTGFAIAETKQLQSLHFILAHHIMKNLETLRHNGTLPWLNPDAKSQVTVQYEYSEKGLDTPLAIDNILVSQCYKNTVSLEKIRKILSEKIIESVKTFVEDNKLFYISTFEQLLKSVDNAEILINPAGAWHIGGPMSDAGLLGRKLVVDNYGSAAPIGGGAYSGKNCNKVDRSGAYYARHIAKSIVASGLADKCLVELGFAIGVPQAISVNIETFGTENTSLKILNQRVKKACDFKVSSMIELSANIDTFVETAKHGHYTSNDFPWEKTTEL